MNSRWMLWVTHFRRELRRIVSDKRILGTMLGGPFLYAFAFGAVYWSGRVEQIPVVVVDEDHSALSRQFTQALFANGTLRLAFYAQSAAEFGEAAMQDRAHACVVIPRGFASRTQRGDQGRVAVLLDGSNVLTGNVASRAIASTVSAFRREARVATLASLGAGRTRAAVAASPIRPVVRPLFNPTAHYGYFVLTGFVLVAIQQVTRMGAAIALCLESSPANRQELGRLGGSLGLIFTAKVAATAVTILPVAAVAMQLPYWLFGSPFHAGVVLPALVLVLFVVMQILMGYAVAGVCRSAEFSLQLLLFVSVPLFTLAGYTWPAIAMPDALRTVSTVIPLTHMTEIFRKLGLAGADPGLLWRSFAVLAVWLPVTIGCGYWGFRRQLLDPPASGKRRSPRR